MKGVTAATLKEADRLIRGGSPLVARFYAENDWPPTDRTKPAFRFAFAEWLVKRSLV